ncbi:MAG: zinc ribbon domain-containing protein [Anaerolineae bacterium]|nr:zinc ribbon domain-containing protein [Anaerolineae bacterium]
MPIYEYRCATCKRRVSIFWRSFAEAEQGQARCPRCGGTALERIFSRVAVVRGAGSADADDVDLPGLEDVDENDPRSIARWMRRMSEETGEDLGEEFHEVVDRLEAGQTPEEIEAAMPELAGSEEDFGDDLD